MLRLPLFSVTKNCQGVEPGVVFVDNREGRQSSPAPPWAVLTPLKGPELK